MQMTPAGAITAYRAHLEHRGLRPNYIDNQRRTLQRLSRFTPLLEADTTDLTAYLDSRRYQTGARAVEIAHLRGFYAWAVEQSLVSVDPSRRLIRPRRRRMIPRPMPVSSMTVAFDNPPNRVGPILYFAYYAGLRRCEIAQLRAEDITDRIVINESKGGGMSSVPVAPALRDALARYPLPAEGWLFPSPRGGHLTPTRIGQLGNWYLHDLGIPFTLHTLRHRFCTDVYAHTKDLRVTQDLARHEDPRWTAGYTAVDIDNTLDGLSWAV